MEVKVLPNKLKETLSSGGKVYGTMLWGIQGTRLIQTLSSDYIDYVDYVYYIDVFQANHFLGICTWKMYGFGLYV